MKSFLIFSCFFILIFSTGCLSHPIENVSQIHGYYTTSDDEYMLIVSPYYFMTASKWSSDYSKRHNLNLYSFKNDYHVIRNMHGYFIILGQAGTCYSSTYKILSRNELKNGGKYLFGLIDETTIFKKISENKAKTILQSWGYDFSKIEKAEYSNKFSCKRKNKGEVLYDTFSLRNSCNP